MAADLYKMQDDQRFPEIRIDKLEFVTLLYTDTHPEFEYTHGYAHR